MRLLYTILAQLVSMHMLGLNVAIIESQSLIGPTVAMDEKWKSVISLLGHTTQILPQSALNQVQNLYQFDVLIVSSGEIEFSSTATQTVLDFLALGRPVYLQCEYRAEYTTNKAFVSIVETLGGEFVWDQSYEGTLEDIEIIGTFSSDPNLVHGIDFYWYSVSGIGDCRTVPILKYGETFHGFHYYPLNEKYGTIITTSDQDWINTGGLQNRKFMENIFNHLVDPPLLTAENSSIDLGADSFLCSGDTIILHVNNQNALSYVWQDNSVESQYTVAQSGIYSVTVNEYCGMSTGQVQITFVDPPIVDFCCDSLLCEGELIILNAAVPGGSYIWDDGSTQSVLQVEQPGEHFVIIENACNSDTFFITTYSEDCSCSIYVPNIFTPNQDHINDEVSLGSNCFLYDYHFSIFDRWGNRVFVSEDPVFTWDGEFRGKPLPGGVYAYLLRYRTGINEKVQYGDITLIR